MRSTLVSPHGSKNDECYMRSTLVSPHGSKNNEYYMRSALVSRHGSKNDECYMCSAHVWRHGFKKDVHFICSALVLPHGFKNEVCFMCSTLVSPHGWEIFSLSLANWTPGSPIDSCQDELSLSGPIESICQHLQLPSLLLTSYFRYHWSSALRPFPGVLDMSGWRRPWGHVCLEEQFKMALIFKMTRFACRKIYYHLSRRTIDERSFHSRSCTTVALGA